MPNITKKTKKRNPTQQPIPSSRQDILLLFPVHLFELDILLPMIQNKDKPTPPQIIIWEHPVYYGIHSKQAHLNMKYNKLKLAYVRTTCLAYIDYMKSHGHRTEFIPVDATKKQLTTFQARLKAAAVTYFDPVDNIVQQELDILLTKGLNNGNRLATPGFLLTDTDLDNYWNQSSHTRFYHSSFYTWVRKRLDILPGSKTYDTENRGKLPDNVKIPALPTIPHHSAANSHAAKLWKQARDFVCERWPDNPGPDEGDDGWELVFPLTHEASVRWLDKFIKERFADFGKYQDSIVVASDGNPRNFLFHSCISPMLNIGLITPRQVIDAVTKAKDSIPMAAYEGFIRQIIGWREYQRYIYKYAGDKMRTSNHFGNKRRLTSAWYEGTTGIKPVDDAIKMAFRDGYLHHILRLMVIGNFMNLIGIHPDDVYKWFMEFSLDSYDWVMVGNVYSMALWADGGMSMRKPYISSSGYILSMSNYTKNQPDNWSDKWDAVYHHFIDRNSSKLLKTYYAGVVRAWNKKPSIAKQTELTMASKIITQISS